MTGTAMTEAAEFWKIYKLDVIAIPTNKPLIRLGQSRRHLPHRAREVRNAVVERDHRVSVQKGRPVLVGTVSIEKVGETSARS